MWKTYNAVSEIRSEGWVDTYFAIFGLVLLAVGVWTLGGAHHAGLVWVVSGWWINGKSCVVSIIAAWDVGEFALVI